MIQWDLGKVTVTETDSGFLGVQHDAAGSGDEGVLPGEALYPYGFYARPADPSAAGACTVLYGYRGDSLYSLPMVDPRAIQNIPSLKKGASVQYNFLGSFAHLENDSNNGTHTVYVPVEFSGTTPSKAHLVQVGLESNDASAITILHADGMRITMLDNKTVIASPNNQNWIEVSDDGISFNGNINVNGNLGPGLLMQAWMADVATKFTSAGFPLAVTPPPQSLTV